MLLSQESRRYVWVVVDVTIDSALASVHIDIFISVQHITTANEAMFRPGAAYFEEALWRVRGWSFGTHAAATASQW